MARPARSDKPSESSSDKGKPKDSHQPSIRTQETQSRSGDGSSSSSSSGSSTDNNDNRDSSSESNDSSYDDSNRNERDDLPSDDRDGHGAHEMSEGLALGDAADDTPQTAGFSERDAAEMANAFGEETRAKIDEWQAETAKSNAEAAEVNDKLTKLGKRMV
jgi:hypothetical protein